MTRKKKSIIWVVSLAVIFGVIFYFSSQESEIRYETEGAKIGNVFQTVSVTGEFVPAEEINLSFESGGRIESMNVEVGDKVLAEQAIAGIDDSVLRSQLSEARLALGVQIENEKLARRDWETLKPEEREAKKITTEKSRAAVQTVLRQLEKANIFSPIDGMVTARNFEVGEVAGINASVVTIIKEGDLKLEANVPESDIVKIEVGQSAMVTFDALPSDEQFETEVVEIDPAATVLQDVVYYKVKLKLKSDDSRLKPGMSADIDINTDERRNVLVIPERAIDTQNGKKTVQILKDGDQAETVEIKTGLRGDEGMIEIISGLKEDDSVVTFVENR